MKLKRWTPLWAFSLLFYIIASLGAAISIPVSAQAAPAEQAVTYGADLTQQQKEAMLRVFGITNPGEVVSVEVTNQEERSYLKSLVPEQVIGTRAISSVYVKLLPSGSGISSEIYNITWVTGEMYSNALVTAGVKDAKVIAAAPFPVSGTAALTGVFKAFEKLTGTKLSEERKHAASEELVRTGEIGQALQDKEKATKLIVLVKEKVLANNLKSPEEIKNVVINIAGQLNINLTPDQINKIVELMIRISKTPVNVEELRGQLAGLQDKLNILLQKQEEAKGFLANLWTTLRDFFYRLLALLNIDFSKS